MHEMALMESVVEIALEEMTKAGASKLSRIALDIGRLSAVEPEAMRFCFAAVAAGTRAEGAELTIETSKAPAGAGIAGARSRSPSVSAPAPNAAALGCR